MEIHLTTKSYDMILPVLPASFEVSNSQNNEIVTVHTVGEVNLLGKTGLKTIDLSSFFPNQEYNFANNKNLKKPYDYIKQLTKWKETGAILDLTITSTDISFDVTIEQLTYGEDDVTGDVNYTISLKEYKTLVRSNKTKSSGTSKKNSIIKYKVKKGDTLKKIAKKKMGATKYSKTIYKKNKKAIEAALKKYVKAENKRRKKYNKTHKQKKKLLKWKSSKKGKRLIAGTVLVIPPKPKKTTKKKKKATKKKKK